MISLSKTGNAIKFTFTDNGHYLQNGTIEVPVNSLTLVTDDSDMFTFKKSATNDIFVSGLYSEIGMTKAELETYYKNNMVGSTGGGGDITSGEVQTMIDESISGKADTSAVTESINEAVSGKVDESAFTAYSGAVDSRILENEKVTSAALNVLNTNKLDASAYTPTDLSEYWTSAQTDSAITAATSGKVDTTAFTAYSATVDTALSGKQDTLSAGTNITISGNVISAEGGSITVDNALDDSSENPVQNKVLYDELRYSETTRTETVLQWDNHDGGETTNYPSGSGCSKITFEVVASGETEGDEWYQDEGWFSVNDVEGSIHIAISDDIVTASAENGFLGTCSVNGNIVTVEYPTIADDVTIWYSSYDNHWTTTAYINSTVYTPLINQVSANTAAISDIDDRLSEDEEVTAAALINLSDNFDGLKLKKLTQVQYDALSGNTDSNTLYVIVN